MIIDPSQDVFSDNFFQQERVVPRPYEGTGFLNQFSDTEALLLSVIGGFKNSSVVNAVKLIKNYKDERDAKKTAHVLISPEEAKEKYGLTINKAMTEQSVISLFDDKQSKERIQGLLRSYVSQGGNPLIPAVGGFITSAALDVVPIVLAGNYIAMGIGKSVFKESMKLKSKRRALSGIVDSTEFAGAEYAYQRREVIEGNREEISPDRVAAFGIVGGMVGAIFPYGKNLKKGGEGQALKEYIDEVNIKNTPEPLIEGVRKQDLDDVLKKVKNDEVPQKGILEIVEPKKPVRPEKKSEDDILKSMNPLVQKGYIKYRGKGKWIKADHNYLLQGLEETIGKAYLEKRFPIFSPKEGFELSVVPFKKSEMIEAVKELTEKRSFFKLVKHALSPDEEMFKEFAFERDRIRYVNTIMEQFGTKAYPLDKGGLFANSVRMMYPDYPDYAKAVIKSFSKDDVKKLGGFYGLGTPKHDRRIGVSMGYDARITYHIAFHELSHHISHISESTVSALKNSTKYEDELTAELTAFIIMNRYGNKLGRKWMRKGNVNFDYFFENFENVLNERRVPRQYLENEETFKAYFQEILIERMPYVHRNLSVITTALDMDINKDFFKNAGEARLLALAVIKSALIMGMIGLKEFRDESKKD